MDELLVTNEELSEFRGHPFNDDVLASVSGQVRDICGWHIAPEIKETVLVRSRGAEVLVLPSLKVAEVTRVEDAVTGDEITGYFNWQDGTLELFTGRRFPPAVKVTMTHGYEICPPALLRPIADEAMAEKSGGRVRSESLASRSVQLDSGGSSLAGPLAGPVLAKYTVRSRP